MLDANDRLVLLAPFAYAQPAGHDFKVRAKLETRRHCGAAGRLGADAAICYKANSAETCSCTWSSSAHADGSTGGGPSHRLRRTGLESAQTVHRAGKGYLRVDGYRSVASNLYAVVALTCAGRAVAAPRQPSTKVNVYAHHRLVPCFTLISVGSGM